MTSDIPLAEAWESQVPSGRITLRVGSDGFSRSTASSVGSVVVLDATLEQLLPTTLERCLVIFVGEPRSVVFEEARLARRYKLCISYNESKSRLRELIPLVEEIAEKQSIVDILAAKGRRVEPVRVSQRASSIDSAEIWDLLEGAIEAIDSRERLIAEFRRATRHILRASHAVFFLRESDGFRADRGTSYFQVEDPLVGFFENHPAIIDSSHWDLPIDPMAELAVRNRMALWGARLLVPIHDNARLLGLIALGVRDDGQSYDETDRSRAILIARLLKNLLGKSVHINRLNSLANQIALGAKYLPGTLVLSPDDVAPRHVPLVVRDLIGQVRRTREVTRAYPCAGQPFRASAGIVAETGGIWAFWEEASGEVHDAQARERSGRRTLLRELALTLSHELGNSLVSLVTFRQADKAKTFPSGFIDTIKRDIAYLEGLNDNLSLMHRLHEAEPSPLDVRDIAQAVGRSTGVRVEVGPEPIVLMANRQLLEFALTALIRTLAENRLDRAASELTVKVRATGSGVDATALISLNGRDLELEGILPEPVEGDVPNQGRMGVFLAKEILRIHNGGIHAGPGIEGTEILVSFRSW